MNTNQNVYSQTQTQTQSYNHNGDMMQATNTQFVNGQPVVNKKRNPLVTIALLPFKLIKFILITIPLWIFKTLFMSSFKVIWNFVKLIFAVILIGGIAWGVVWMGNYFNWW